jgi:ferredoxin
LEEYLKRKHIEEINELCTIFTSQKLGINAEAKRAKIKPLFQYPIEQLLGPEQLDKGKLDYDRLSRLSKLSVWKSKPIKDIAQPVMRMGILLHKESCQGADCVHCGDCVDFVPTLEIEHEAAKVFRKLYEDCNALRIDTEGEIRDQQTKKKRNSQKVTFKKLFGAGNIPTEIRFIPGLVRNCGFTCASPSLSLLLILTPCLHLL